MDRESAWNQLCEWTEGESLRRHARAVELVMRSAASQYGNDSSLADTWGIAGLMHDADYEKWPEEHPNKIVQWLRDHDEGALAHAISAHYTKWNVPYESLLDRALLACDELTGFVMACCLVRPGGISTLAVKSVKKKMKDKRFAASVERDEIRAGAELLKVPLEDHIQFVINALKPHGEELKIQGK